MDRTTHPALTYIEEFDIEGVVRLEPSSVYDKFIIGLGRRFNDGPVLVYDMDGILDWFQSEDGMTYEEAVEHFEFNVIGGWYGDGTPMFVFSPAPDGDDLTKETP